MSEIGKTKVGGYLYVVGFDNGLVKVGRTSNPKVRLSTIKGAARTHGATVVSNWLSPLHLSFKPNEKALIQAIREAGGSSAQREYFRGVAFDRAVAEASVLDYPEFDSHEELMRAGDEGREFRTGVIDRAMAQEHNLDSALAPFFHNPEVLADLRRKRTLTIDSGATAVIGSLFSRLSPAAVHDVICLALNHLKARDIDILIHDDAIQTDCADIKQGEDNQFRSVYYCPKIEESASQSPMASTLVGDAA